MNMRPLSHIGLFGFGRFGRFLGLHLGNHLDVAAYDPRPFETALPRGVRWAALEEAAAAPVVVLTVPIRALRPTLVSIAPHLMPSAIVIDTASVKVWPMHWMRTLLPPGTQILGTHPLFGPDSAHGGLQGQKMVTVSTGCRARRSVHRFLEGLGLEVIEATAELHDQQMAETQALTHWVGRGLERMNARPREIDTLGYRRLLEILEYVSNDSRELFEDLERWNPYAAEVRARLLGALIDLDRELPTAGIPEDA